MSQKLLLKLPAFLQRKMQNALNRNLNLGVATVLWKNNTHEYYAALEDGKLTNQEVFAILERNFENVFKDKWDNMLTKINNDAAAWEKNGEKEI